MSSEKKHWRLPTPFRKSSGKQNLRSKSNVGYSRRRVSSVYLSDDTSASGFIVVPEFDDAVRTQTAHEGSNHASYLPWSPVVTCCDPLPPNGVDSSPHDVELLGFYNGSAGGGSCNIPFPTSGDDDLSQRLDSAYEHIRSMPSAVSPKVSLSSDPQMLRKQLGVPQHSVLNYPIHFSPDLPNPHTFPSMPTSPKLPPTTSPDVSPTRKSKRLGLCLNTNEYPASPRPDSPEPFSPAQKESVVTVPTPEESSPSPRGRPDASSTALIACTPKPQPSVSNPSKPTKRRAGKPVTSPSFQPSSRRQASKRVLRKPAPHTPLSTNTHEWQISLPQVRAPSPFKVDIPLHHTWHDRRTTFLSSSEYNSRMTQFLETESRRTSGNTEVLASLAWIGTLPVRSSSFTANQTAFLPDRFSMAIAVEDDSISDDALVDRLEEVRRTCGFSEPGRDQWPPRSLDNASFSSAIAHDTTSDSDDAAVWQAARRALLCIREIIRTEKKYQEAIKMLLNGQTATPPPPSMAPSISALVRVSETLFKRFLEDPSAWGVSTAFVVSEDELEATLVSWCAVAGVLFVDGNDAQSSGLIGRWRQRKFGLGVASSPSPTVAKSLSPRLSDMFPMASTASKIKEQMDEEYSAWQHPQTEQERQATNISAHEPEPGNGQILGGQPPNRKLSVRDLAIQPIQRVMRYVLLYRDLLDCTPTTSPSRLLVERALEAAARIANRCDGAQSNPAFVHVS